MPPFMDVIIDMGCSVLLKGRKKMGAKFIANWKLKMCEESHSKSVKVIVSTSRQFDVPLGYNTYEGSLKKLKTNGIINV